MSAAATPAAKPQSVIQKHFDAQRRRGAVRGWTFALLALAVFAAWAIGPYLSGELRRLEPWKIAVLYSGNLIAAAWFIRFTVQHFVLDAPLEDQPAGPGARLVLKVFFVSMIAGLALDAAFTVYLRYQEGVRYGVATPTTAVVRQMSTNHASQGKNWTLHCEWRDAQVQDIHRASLRVHAGVSGGVASLPPALPGDIARLLERDEMPAMAPIRYDPTWPARAWLEGVPDDDNGLFFVSLFVLMIQGVVILLAAIAAWANAFGPAAVLPWWLELGKMIPAGAEVVVMAFVGALFRAFGV
ncbi:MAG: hypothetical protein ABIP55_13245 [Tepidisphaeraceae bacterium]